MSFSVIDIVFAVIVLAFAFTAWRRGFVAEVLGKLAPVASLLLAALFFGRLAPTVVKYVTVPPALSAVLAFIIIFVFTFIVIKILQVVLSGIIESIDVLSVNKILGLVLGTLEGLVVISAVMIFLQLLPFEQCQNLVRQSFAWGLLGNFLTEPTARVQQFLHSARASAAELV